MNIDRAAVVQNISGMLIGLGLTLILGTVTYALIRFEIPKENQNALLILIGILSTNIGVIVNYYYGSSAGSRKQTDTIATLATTNATAQAALTPNAAPDLVVPPGGTATVAAAETPNP